MINFKQPLGKIETFPRQIAKYHFTARKIMKKRIIQFLLLAVSALAFYSCDSIPDEIVDPDIPHYDLKGITAPFNVKRTEQDSSLVVNVEFASAVSYDVWFRISFENGNPVSQLIRMADNGDVNKFGDIKANDKIFSGKTFMSSTLSSGRYLAEFFITGEEGLAQKLAVHKFSYDNGSSNLAPVISDLIAPDTLVVQSPKSVFLVTLNVSDPNGYLDVESVYFVSTRPDGTSSGNKIFLFDDGNLNEHGDSTAFDGKYSRLLEITPSDKKGLYRFDFQARDRGFKVSNTISHYIFVK